MFISKETAEKLLPILLCAYNVAGDKEAYDLRDELIRAGEQDEVQAAKDLLIANGYVDFFVSSEEIRMVAADMQRELTDEEILSVVEFLSNNDLETGLCLSAVEGAISELCPDATDQDWTSTEMIGA